MDHSLSAESKIWDEDMDCDISIQTYLEGLKVTTPRVSNKFEGQLLFEDVIGVLLDLGVFSSDTYISR